MDRTLEAELQSRVYRQRTRVEKEMREIRRSMAISPKNLKGINIAASSFEGSFLVRGEA